MIFAHLALGLFIYLACQRALHIRLAAIWHIQGLIRNILTKNRVIIRSVAITSVCSVIPPIRQERIIMMSNTGTD